MSDPVELTKALIACESVTPATGSVFDCLSAMLAPHGFTVHRFIEGADAQAANEGPVENLLAVRLGPAGSRHFAFAGHLDVVPAGEGWTGGAFAPEVRGNLLYGRGAVDMKGAIASMVAAVADIPADAGTISFIITGDEEGEARYGTRALMQRMAELGAEAGGTPDLILVGEPTSVNRLGDMMKIGRRGSINAWFVVEGREGHVAYPHLADNPLPRLVALLADLDRLELDEGTDWFQPSNLEITDVSVGNKATNVIPARATGRISIRFNDRHSGAGLVARLEEVAARHGALARPVIYGEPFLTPPGEFSAMIAQAVEAETGVRPEPSTTGGTSDARFLKEIAPVIEFGLCNATMHKRDEAVAIEDLAVLARIYRRIALAALQG
jgi:succinyl-diaminopimelate desuccinylase